MPALFLRTVSTTPEAPPKRMPKLKLNLTGAQSGKDYFKDVSDRLAAIGVSRNALARQMEMDPAQLGKYFTDEDPNPTIKTIAAIEDAIVTLRRREAQRKPPTTPPTPSE